MDQLDLTDEEFLNSKDKIKLPSNFEERFLALLNELEETTNEFFTITIKQSGSNNEFKIKPFDQRSGYVISDMKTNYEGLNGTYPNFESINQKTVELMFGDLRQPDEKTWKCPKCGKNEKNHLSDPLCQFCKYHLDTIWNDVLFSLESQTVYSSSGSGSVSICHPIGKIQIQK